MEGLCVSQTMVFTGYLRMKVGVSSPSIVRASKKGVVDGEELEREMETFNKERMSLPNRGTGHCGISRNECAKGWGVPCTWQVSGGVLRGYIFIPPTPTIGEVLRVVGPRNSRRTEKVAPVSKRKEMGRPSTSIITLGSLLVMLIVGEDPGPCQSSSATPNSGGSDVGSFGGRKDPSPL